MFVRVFLAASRLQLRSLDVFVLHTSHRGAAARAVGMIDENEHPIESSRVDLVSPCLRGGTHLALGTTVAFRKLLPEKTLTASPLGIPQVLLAAAAGLFVFKSRWTEVL